MATYISLVKFTSQGAQNFKETGHRAADFKAAAKKIGVKVKEVYWCLGAYDGVLIFEASDDETATAGMLSLSALGNVSTQTMRSFSAAEMAKIIAKT